MVVARDVNGSGCRLRKEFERPKIALTLSKTWARQVLGAETLRVYTEQCRTNRHAGVLIVSL
jgi:hypothetical protein